MKAKRAFQELSLAVIAFGGVVSILYSLKVIKTGASLSVIGGYLLGGIIILVGSFFLSSKLKN